MAQKIEAIFYNEDAAQNAITALANENIDISAVTLRSAGKSLIAQTFENAKQDVLGNSTGFVYATFPSNLTPSIMPYPLPEATAILAKENLSASHKLGIDASNDLPHEKEDMTGSCVALTMRTDTEKAQKAENLLRLCGAYRIRFQ